MSLTKKVVNTKKTCKVTFTIPEAIAPNSEFVSIVGEFNNWNFDNAEMRKLKSGAFEKTLEIPTGASYQFRYRTNDGTWFNDEAADAYIWSPFAGTENSVVDLTQLKEEKAASPKAKKTSVVKKTSSEIIAEAKPDSKLKIDSKTAEKNDLTKIEGVGPKIAKLLFEKGFMSYDEVAKAKVSDLQAVLTEAGSRYAVHKADSWPAQAKLAAAGSWEKLKLMQDKLKGGK